MSRTPEAPEIRKVRNRQYRDAYPEKKKADNRKWDAANRGKRATHQLEYRYGLTPGQYEIMLEAQGGVCAICRESCPTGRRLAVDHDHACCSGNGSCGKCVRGLLCINCNAALGRLRDDIGHANRLIQYLAKHGQNGNGGATEAM